MSRHVKQPPTREKFFDVTAVSGGAAAFGGLGGFYGGDLDGDGEYAYIQVHVPHNFAKLKDLKLLIIPTATNAAMTMRITTNYAKPKEPYTQQNKTVDDKTFNAVTNILTEVDITDMVDLPSNQQLEKNDYLGIAVSRQGGDTLDGVIIGARLKYS
jgi:hypothetical protein